MESNSKYGVLPNEKTIKRTAAALEQNGIRVFIVQNAVEAKQKVFELIPNGAEVMNMTSMTLEATGVAEEILDSGRYDSVRKKMAAMDTETQGKDKKKMASAPDWAVGSVHAVTEEGRVIVASATGSQLPAYVYGAGNVIWIVGAQKLVENLDDGMKRLYDYVFPLENERAQKAYGRESSVNKILIINRDVPGRTTMIIVREKLGF